MRTTALIVSAALSAALLACASTAAATPVFELLPSPNRNGGLSPVVSDPSSSAAYFNPAMLEWATEDTMLGVGLLSEQIGLTLDGRRSGADVPLAVGARDIVGPDGKPLPNGTVPTQWLENGCEKGGAAGECPAPAFPARPRQSDGSAGRPTPTSCSAG